MKAAWSCRNCGHEIAASTGTCCYFSVRCGYAYFKVCKACFALLMLDGPLSDRLVADARLKIELAAAPAQGSA